MQPKLAPKKQNSLASSVKEEESKEEIKKQDLAHVKEATYAVLKKVQGITSTKTKQEILFEHFRTVEDEI